MSGRWWALAWIGFLGGCTDGDLAQAPIHVDLVIPDAVEASDVPDDPLQCEVLSDCPVISDCCLASACVAGRCTWQFIPGCCNESGPCAASTLHRTGLCEATCTRGGCTERLRLEDVDCGDVLVDWRVWPVADMSASQELRGTGATLQWQQDARHPWQGVDTWMFGDARCDLMVNQTQGLACDTMATEHEGFRSELWFPAVELPQNVPVVLSGFWRDGRDPDPFVDSTATPVMRIESVDAGGTARTVWSSAAEPLVPGWRPLLADVTPLSAGTVRLRAVVESTAGTGRRDRSFGLESLQLRIPCAAERAAPATGPVCGEAVTVAIQPTVDALQVRLPRDATRACERCDEDSDCTPARSACATARCDNNHWCTEEDATSSETCCTYDSNGRVPLDVDVWSGSGAAWRNDPTDGSLWFPLATFEGAPAGAIESPVLVAPGSDPMVSIRLRLATEWDVLGAVPNSAGVDRFTVSVLPVAGPFEPARVFDAVDVWDSDRIGGSTQGEVVAIAASLPVAAGVRFRLRLAFDAVDADFNDFDGVRVLSATLGSRCRECGPAEACVMESEPASPENPVGGAFPR